MLRPRLGRMSKRRYVYCAVQKCERECAFSRAFLNAHGRKAGCRNNRNAIGSLAESKLRVEPWYRANRGRHSLSCRGTQQAETTDEDSTTKVLVGHGPLAAKADIAEFHDMLVTSAERIKKLLDEGKTEQEVLDAKSLADLDAKWAPNNPQLAAAHARNVYNSFKRL